jgi:hypothetical protein
MEHTNAIGNLILKLHEMERGLKGGRESVCLCLYVCACARELGLNSSD